MKLTTVRDAVDIAQREHGIGRLLIHENLRYAAGELFLKQLGAIEHLSRSEQLWMREMLDASLRRIKWDKDQLPADFWPVGKRPGASDQKLILVSPYLSFGSAIVERRGITTHAIKSRFDLGEERSAIVVDYDLKEEEFDEAILYEAVAAWSTPGLSLRIVTLAIGYRTR